MKIASIFIGQVLLFCTVRYGTDAAVIHSSDSNLFLTGEINSHTENLYHKKTEKYYPIYTRGPCGKLMWIERESPESGIGVCQCIKSPLGLRSLIYWPSKKRCYFESDQGPCKSEEWLQYNKEERDWECQENPCPISLMERDVGIDLESLVELETDYYFIDNDDKSTCLRNQLVVKNWHINFNAFAVSRFLYHEESQGFFPNGERGPCPTLMELAPDSHHAQRLGECVCRTLDNLQRPIVYWEATNRCYFAYTQGPCGNDEWLVGHGKENAACKKHHCDVTPTENEEKQYGRRVLKPDIQFFVSDKKGNCYETNTQAFCKKKEKMFLMIDGITPYCNAVNAKGEPILNTGSSYSTPIAAPPDCGSGFTRDPSGRCVRQPSW